ncbi:MAG: YdeI/OmpD-associated family protein [Planctomycetota bacterium]
MDDYQYQFEAKLVKSGMGDVEFTVAYVPKEITSKLEFGKSKRLRIDGEVNGVRIELALMPQRGKWFLLISKKLQKLAGLSRGDTASIAFDVADQDAIHVPRELQYALEANDSARAVWESWTPGKRRGFCFRVDSAKRSETRERRVMEVIEALLAEKE